MDESKRIMRGNALEIMAGAVVYSVLAWVGLEMALVSQHVSVVWPASGVALVLLFVRGRKLWPAVALGALAAYLINGAPVLAAFGMAAGNTLEALAGAALLTSLGFSLSLKRVRDVAALFLLSATLSPMISATVGVASLCLAHAESWNRFDALWSLWWTGNAIGQLIVAPFLFVWVAQTRRGCQVQRMGETTALTVGLLALSLMVFMTRDTEAAYPVHYLIFPAVIWSALRLGQHATAILVLGISTVTTVATLGGHGPFVSDATNASLIDVQLFMAVVSVTGLFLGAATAERNAAERRRSADYAQLRQSQEHLALAARQLAEADRRKDEFLAVLGHELRNPLAPLQNSVALLARRPSDPRAVTQARVIMERQLRHLVRLVDDLLDVSRIRSGKIVMAKQVMELVAAVESAVEMSRPGIDARKHRLIVNLPREPIFVDADPTRLPQLVANLLNNAAKYTDDGGEIDVTIEQLDRDAVVRVRDSGIGMSPAEIAGVFELFAQAGRADHAVQGGLGVGLSLAKSLAELHGGSLIACSAGLGHGSEFTLRLPVATAPPVAAATREQHSDRPSGLRVLVVDDNVDAVESLAFLLGDCGHTVQTAHGGVEALAAAKNFMPDVMILDLGMPEMDGYAVARAIRSDAALTGIRLIALSGYGQPDDRRRSAEAGFEIHLIKPVAPEKLNAVLLQNTAHVDLALNPPGEDVLLTRFSTQHSKAR